MNEESTGEMQCLRRIVIRMRSSDYWNVGVTRMDIIKWIDRERYEEFLQENRTLFKTVLKLKRKCVRHTTRGKITLTTVLEVTVDGENRRGMKRQRRNEEAAEK